MRRSTAITLILLGGGPLLGAIVALPLLIKHARGCYDSTIEPPSNCSTTNSGSHGGSGAGSSRNFVGAGTAMAVATTVARGGFGGTGSSISGGSGG